METHRPLSEILPRYRRWAAAVIAISFMLNGVTWLGTRFFPAEDPTAVLHYSIDIGVDFIGQGRQIMVLPLIGSLLMIFNTILGASLVRANWRAAVVIWAVIPAVQIVMFAAFFLLWRVNA